MRAKDVTTNLPREKDRNRKKPGHPFDMDYHVSALINKPGEPVFY